jgi:ABC-2 type transport system permease protein
MKELLISLWAESLKIRKSKIFLITFLLFSFIAVMMGLLILVAHHPEVAGRSATVSAKASLVGNADWPSFWSLLIQVILSLGTMGYGFVASWVFGREYSDRVIKDLLALPISRLTIVISKFIVITVWCIVLTLTLWIVGFFAGLAVHMPNWSTQNAFDNFSVYLTSSFLTILLCTPVAFIASLGRGFLLPIGFTIFTLIMTNLVCVGVPGFSPYFPWAFPAFFSGITGDALPHLNAWSYLIFISTVLSGFIGTGLWWRFADQT